MPRRVLVHLCADTVDIDIENCMFTILHWIVSKVDIQPAMPPALMATLESCALHRDKCITEQLHVGVCHGKSLLTSACNGARVSEKFNGLPLIKEVKQLGRYMRWMACAMLPVVYEDRLDCVDCD